MQKTHQRLLLVILGAVTLLLFGLRPVQAGEPVTVARIKLTASLVCASGREAQLAHIALSVPQGNAAVTFSRPVPFDDPYSVWWVTVNPCSSSHKEQVRVNLRNITTSGFMATIRPDELRAYWTASEHQRYVTAIGDTATLTIHSEVLSTESYPDTTEAVMAAHAAPAEVDAKDGVPSKFGGIGLVRSWGIDANGR